MKIQKHTATMLLTASLLITATSCRAQTVSKVYDSRIIENVTRLSPEVSGYVPDGHETSVYVWRDSLVLVLNHADGDKCKDVMETFLLEDFSPAGTYLPFGSGPGQFFYVLTALKGDSLVVFDIVKKQVLASSLGAAEEGRIMDTSSAVSVSYISQALAMYGNRLLLLNPRYFEGPDGRSNHQPLLVMTDTLLQWTVPGTEYFPTNVVKGSLAADPGKGKVFFFDSYSATACLYAGDMRRPLMQLLGPGLDKPEYMFVTGQDGTVSVYHESTPATHYVDAVSDGMQVIAAYRDGNGGDFLFRFDWDGNLLDIFRLEGHVRTLSLSMDGSAVYVWEESVEENSAARLCRYRLR